LNELDRLRRPPSGWFLHEPCDQDLIGVSGKPAKAKQSIRYNKIDQIRIFWLLMVMQARADASAENIRK
jgi:hypothetical protein